MMHGRGKSDSPGVSRNLPNNAAEPAAEAGERRGLAKGNSLQRTTPRTQRRAGVSHALERVRQAAKRDREQRFTALRHHGYAIERLRAAYEARNPRASAGIDGETGAHYGQNLEADLRDLAGRLQRGADRAQPVRRAYIPKADGRQRPLGVPALEDKLVQRAVVEVLDASYDTGFLGFSSGFRPGRRPHDALDALSTGLLTKEVNWVLDADIRSFFDTLEHGWPG
jgi:retron-type reverse transcriptase